ncbi:hypothetical protein XENOCAPTIV_022609 [Xenoophorus captivus]|uniref:Uncharacterized protein n=1 Tax=Xenoophorus captivus TaxID=1517983 RepID=A0ABV0S0A0_9TELE
MFSNKPLRPETEQLHFFPEIHEHIKSQLNTLKAIVVMLQNVKKLNGTIAWSYLVQCNVPVQSSITVSWLEVHCAALSDWSEHSWQRAVCHPTGPLAQAGRQTDGGSAG